jgi:endoglucanase
VLAELRRGINLAGVLDRRDGRPGWPLLGEDMTAIADAGFTAVRLPVCWWGRAADPLERVDAVVGHARAQGLAVVLTMHHADAVYENPLGSTAPLTALWRRIAAHFVGSDGPLEFELLNEPRPPMTPTDWNALLPVVLAGVREVDPTRLVIAGGAQTNPRRPTRAGASARRPHHRDAALLRPLPLHPPKAPPGRPVRRTGSARAGARGPTAPP